MSIHTRQDLEKLSRFTRQKFSHALMSDTKWRKLFVAIGDSQWLPSLVKVKFVESDEPADRLMRWPSANSFWAPRQWIDTPEFGPIELRSIEWLLIPSTVVTRPGISGLAPSGVSQDFKAIENALSRIGQFPLETGSEGLKIIGYR